MKAALAVSIATGLFASLTTPAAADPVIAMSITVGGIVLPACRAGQSQVVSQQGRIIRLDTGGICRNQLGYEVSVSRSEALAGAIIILDGRPMAGTPAPQADMGRANDNAPLAGTLGLKISPKL